jgi:hypothetical protein
MCPCAALTGVLCSWYVLSAGASFVQAYVREFRLAGPAGDGRHAYVNRDGAFIRSTQLGYVADALNNGDLALAAISLLHAKLPPLPSSEHALAMAKADGLTVKYNQNWEQEPRVPKNNPTEGSGRATADG